MLQAVTNMADSVYLALAWLFFKDDADLYQAQFLIINYKYLLSTGIYISGKGHPYL
jgi:hypothetical protein